jgi:hypothetical protein
VQYSGGYGLLTEHGHTSSLAEARKEYKKIQDSKIQHCSRIGFFDPDFKKHTIALTSSPADKCLGTCQDAQTLVRAILCFLKSGSSSSVPEVWPPPSPPLPFQQLLHLLLNARVVANVDVGVDERIRVLIDGYLD